MARREKLWVLETSEKKMTLLLLLFFNVMLNLPGTQAIYFGQKVGPLSELNHGVKGVVYAVDSRTIHIKDFSYDGAAPDAFFYTGLTGEAPHPDGIIIPDEKGGKEPLKGYHKKDVTLTLPDGLTFKDIPWFAVWCREYAVNFGHVKIPKTLDYPRPQKIDGLPTFNHGVSSDKIVVVDAQTFLIPNFHYDGQAPDAFFWVGTGKPSPAGTRVPDENGSLNPLKQYTGKTIVITLPGDLTVFDIDHLGVWCRAFTVDFGHVVIPKNLNVPPSLKMLGVAPQTKLNCEVLYDELAFEVRWAVAGDSIVMQLVGKVDNGEYMAFGLSGSDSRSIMIGGDVTVAWLDQVSGKGEAEDYSLTAKSQCQGGAGSCPDSKIPGNKNNVRLLNAAFINDFTMLTFQRPLSGGDRSDKSFNVNSPQAVIWAIGPVNSQGDTSYHRLRQQGDILIDFGRSPKWNCPLPDEQASSKPVNTRRPTPSTKVAPAPAKPVANPWHIPAIPCYEPEDGVFYAQMGPTGGEKGYNAITGHVGWGIAWYINGLLIPEINVVRGKTYTFVVEGGSNSNSPAKYHPFYITDDPEGGYEFKTKAERANVKVLAGVENNLDGSVSPTAFGRLCEWKADTAQNAINFDSFGAYQRTLTLDCQEGQPGILQWTPDKDTPDTVYYQCFTHRFLGWKINVLDSCDGLATGSSGAQSTTQNIARGSRADYDYYAFDDYSDQKTQLDVNPDGTIPDVTVGGSTRFETRVVHKKPPTNNNYISHYDEDDDYPKNPFGFDSRDPIVDFDMKSTFGFDKKNANIFDKKNSFGFESFPFDVTNRPQKKPFPTASRRPQSSEVRHSIPFQFPELPPLKIESDHSPTSFNDFKRFSKVYEKPGKSSRSHEVNREKSSSNIHSTIRKSSGIRGNLPSMKDRFPSLISKESVLTRPTYKDSKVFDKTTMNEFINTHTLYEISSTTPSTTTTTTPRTTTSTPYIPTVDTQQFKRRVTYNTIQRTSATESYKETSTPRTIIRRGYSKPSYELRENPTKKPVVVAKPFDIQNYDDNRNLLSNHKDERNSNSNSPVISKGINSAEIRELKYHGGNRKPSQDEVKKPLYKLFKNSNLNRFERIDPNTRLPYAKNDGFDPSSVVYETDFRPLGDDHKLDQTLAFKVSSTGSSPYVISQDSYLKKPGFQSNVHQQQISRNRQTYQNTIQSNEYVAPTSLYKNHEPTKYLYSQENYVPSVIPGKYVYYPLSTEESNLHEVEEREESFNIREGNNYESASDLNKYETAPDVKNYENAFNVNNYELSPDVNETPSEQTFNQYNDIQPVQSSNAHNGYQTSFNLIKVNNLQGQLLYADEKLKPPRLHNDDESNKYDINYSIERADEEVPVLPRAPLPAFRLRPPPAPLGSPYKRFARKMSQPIDNNDDDDIPREPKTYEDQITSETLSYLNIFPKLPPSVIQTMKKGQLVTAYRINTQSKENYNNYDNTLEESRITPVVAIDPHVRRADHTHTRLRNNYRPPSPKIETYANKPFSGAIDLNYPLYGEESSDIIQQISVENNSESFSEPPVVDNDNKFSNDTTIEKNSTVKAVEAKTQNVESAPISPSKEITESTYSQNLSEFDYNMGTTNEEIELTPVQHPEITVSEIKENPVSEQSELLANHHHPVEMKEYIESKSQDNLRNENDAFKPSSEVGGNPTHHLSENKGSYGKNQPHVSSKEADDEIGSSVLKNHNAGDDKNLLLEPGTDSDELTKDKNDQIYMLAVEVSNDHGPKRVIEASSGYIEKKPEEVQTDNIQDALKIGNYEHFYEPKTVKINDTQNIHLEQIDQPMILNVPETSKEQLAEVRPTQTSNPVVKIYTNTTTPSKMPMEVAPLIDYPYQTLPDKETVNPKPKEDLESQSDFKPKIIPEASEGPKGETTQTEAFLRNSNIKDLNEEIKHLTYSKPSSLEDTFHIGKENTVNDMNNHQKTQFTSVGDRERIDTYTNNKIKDNFNQKFTISLTDGQYEESLPSVDLGKTNNLGEKRPVSNLISNISSDNMPIVESSRDTPKHPIDLPKKEENDGFTNKSAETKIMHKSEISNNNQKNEFNNMPVISFQSETLKEPEENSAVEEKNYTVSSSLTYNLNGIVKADPISLNFGHTTGSTNLESRPETTKVKNIASTNKLTPEENNPSSFNANGVENKKINDHIKSEFDFTNVQNSEISLTNMEGEKLRHDNRLTTAKEEIIPDTSFNVNKYEFGSDDSLTDIKPESKIDLRLIDRNQEFRPISGMTGIRTENRPDISTTDIKKEIVYDSTLTDVKKEIKSDVSTTNVRKEYIPDSNLADVKRKNEYDLSSTDTRKGYIPDSSLTNMRTNRPDVRKEHRPDSGLIDFTKEFTADSDVLKEINPDINLKTFRNKDLIPEISKSNIKETPEINLATGSHEDKHSTSSIDAEYKINPHVEDETKILHSEITRPASKTPQLLDYSESQQSIPKLPYEESSPSTSISKIPLPIPDDHSDPVRKNPKFDYKKSTEQIINSSSKGTHLTILKDIWDTLTADFNS